MAYTWAVNLITLAKYVNEETGEIVGVVHGDPSSGYAVEMFYKRKCFMKIEQAKKWVEENIEAPADCAYLHEHLSVGGSVIPGVKHTCTGR